MIKRTLAGLLTAVIATLTFGAAAQAAEAPGGSTVVKSGTSCVNWEWTWGEGPCPRQQ